MGIFEGLESTTGMPGRRMRGLERILKGIDEGRADRVARILQPFVQGVTLDVGCWNGVVAQRLRHKSIIGLDVVEVPEPRIECLRFDGQQIPFVDKAFDTVLCCTALHHAEDPGSLIEEMKRVGKRLVVLEDAYDTVFDRLSVLLLHILGYNFVPIPYRLNGFRSSRSWRRFFGLHGLDVLFYSRNSGIQPYWWFLQNDLYVLA